MDFFGVGSNELLFIMLLAGIVLGPRRLAVMARETGKLIRNLKSYFSSLADELKAELDVLEEIKEVKEDLDIRFK